MQMHYEPRPTAAAPNPQVLLMGLSTGTGEESCSPGPSDMSLLRGPGTLGSGLSIQPFRATSGHPGRYSILIRLPRASRALLRKSTSAMGPRPPERLGRHRACTFGPAANDRPSDARSRCAVPHLSSPFHHIVLRVQHLLLGDGARSPPSFPDAFSQSFDRLVARSTLSRIRLHDLKHTHASILLKAGVPVKVVCERLGHANPAFTITVYQHIIPGIQPRRPGSSRLSPPARLSTSSEDPFAGGPPLKCDKVPLRAPARRRRLEALNHPHVECG